MKVNEITEGWFDFVRGAMNPRKHLAVPGVATTNPPTPAGVKDPYLHNELLKMGDEALAGGKERAARMTPDIRKQIDAARKLQGSTAVDWATLDNPPPPTTTSDMHTIDTRPTISGLKPGDPGYDAVYRAAKLAGHI